MKGKDYKNSYAISLNRIFSEIIKRVNGVDVTLDTDKDFITVISSGNSEFCFDLKTLNSEQMQGLGMEKEHQQGRCPIRFSREPESIVHNYKYMERERKK